MDDTNAPRGTPHNLDDLVVEIMTAPASLVNGRPVVRLRIAEIIQDYLAQSFSVAMFKSQSEGETERLEALFKRLMRRWPNPDKL